MYSHGKNKTNISVEIIPSRIFGNKAPNTWCPRIKMLKVLSMENSAVILHVRLGKKKKS